MPWDARSSPWRRSCADGIQPIRHARAARPERPHRQLEHPNDHESGLAVASRLLAVANALDEVAHLHLQRLGHRNAGAVDVAGPIAASKLVALELVDALVVDLHLLDRLIVIVDDHLL